MVAQAIASDFDSEGWINTDSYWTDTTPYNVYSYLVSCNNPNTYTVFSTNWWCGDYNFNYLNGIFHLGCHGEGGETIMDSNVYTYANLGVPSKQYFDFIWTCANGNLYWNDTYGNQTPVDGITYSDLNITAYPNEPNSPPDNSANTEYGYFDYLDRCVGMPLAWTGIQDMGRDGYSDPDYSGYCYIGFLGHSPWIQDAPPGWGSTPTAYFPYWFYRYAMGQDSSGVHEPIWICLEYASMMYFGDDFQYTPIGSGWWQALSDPDMYEGQPFWWYNQMKVYGDATLTLPD